MDTKPAREIANIIKNEPLSVLFILSIVFLPFIINQWESLFPESWRLYIDILILVGWAFAGYQLRKEIIIWRRKTILYNYLVKQRRHTINHLGNEWDGKKEFTEKNIEDLLLIYPDVFKRVKVRSDEKYYPGVGLVPNITENDNHEVSKNKILGRSAQPSFNRGISKSTVQKV